MLRASVHSSFIIEIKAAEIVPGSEFLSHCFADEARAEESWS